MAALHVCRSAASAAVPLPACSSACTRACAGSRQPSAVQQRLVRSRTQRRLPRTSAAAGSGSGGSGGAADDASPEASPDAAFAACEACMALLRAPRLSPADLDAVVAYLPDTVIDRLLERKRSKLQEEGLAALSATAEAADELSFEELVALAQPSDLALDSYSARGVLNAAPRSASVLSSLKLAPDRFLQRYAVVAESGEDMVLTVDMQLEECLQPKYRGLQVVKRWFLKGITGEPAYPGDLPQRPEPCWGPEAVCQAQLEALAAGDARRVFRFASPENQAATGPPERFAQMLESPLYRPLLHHEAADLLRSVQMAPDTALLIVGVRSNLPTSEPGVTQRVVYSWTLRLQGAAAGPDFADCWMTEAVQPISQNLFGTTGL